LVSQGFDFTKVFSKGISFMSKENEEKARTKVMKLIEDKKVPRGLIYPSNNKDHAEQIDRIM
jgi:hypothetical protein